MSAVALVGAVGVPASGAAGEVARVGAHLALVHVGAAVAEAQRRVEVAPEAVFALAVMPR